MIEALLGFIAGLTAGYYIERHKTLEALAEINERLDVDETKTQAIEFMAEDEE